jgi:23S rRNA (pseudouridine1915-N3)-methyltransferase
MKINLITIGKTDEPYLQTGIQDYKRRIKHYLPFEIIEIPGVRNVSSMTQAEIKIKECGLFSKYNNPGDVMILLDEHGKELRSVEFAAFLNKQFLTGLKSMNFFTGGAFGYDENFKRQATHIISLSKMTFSHQMVRLFFVEQLYRALTILRGEMYHHE